MIKKGFFYLTFLMFFTSLGYAQQPEPVKVYTGPVPGVESLKVLDSCFSWRRT